MFSLMHMNESWCTSANRYLVLALKLLRLESSNGTEGAPVLLSHILKFFPLPITATSFLCSAPCCADVLYHYILSMLLKQSHAVERYNIHALAEERTAPQAHSLDPNTST